MNAFLNTILTRVHTLRDETATQCCEDMVLSDGTVMYSKEQGLAQVASYDKLLDAIKHQAGVSGADPK